MIIGLDEVRKIVKNLGDRDLHNPEGAGVDLRLGELHRLSGGEAFIECDGKAGQGLRSGFSTEVVARFDPNNDDQAKVVIHPGEYYLVKTVESIDTPLDVLSDFRPRSTLFRAGLNLFTSTGSPGYRGELIFGLANLGPFPVTLQMGCRVAIATFHRLEQKGVQYRGQHMGGRVTPNGIERQV